MTEGVNECRRGMLRAAAGAALSSCLPNLARAVTAPATFSTRSIPRTGERIPVVGLGTASVFDVDGDASKRAVLGVVIQTLAEAGGHRIIDTASTYGTAEAVVGDLVAMSGVRSRIFLATKLESPDAQELRQSLKRLHVEQLDLLQLHNVRDSRQSLAQFREWKNKGVCRYVGITSTYHRDFAAVEAVLARERPEFLQIDYSMDNREVEKRLLPLAAETNTAVLTALPFGRGRLFRAVRGKELPDFAAEFDAQTWAQFFLKFLLADSRVTAVIPGTSDPAHLADNLAAGIGRLPDVAMRERMLKFVESL